MSTKHQFYRLEGPQGPDYPVAELQQDVVVRPEPEEELGQGRPSGVGLGGHQAGLEAWSHVQIQGLQRRR